MRDWRFGDVGRARDVVEPLRIVALGEIGAEVDAARFGALHSRPNHQPRDAEQVLQFPPRAGVKLAG